MNEIKDPDQLIFGLDIGTRSIVGTVGYRENANTFKVVAQVVKEHETRAMLDGQIHDIGKVAETIGRVKRELEQKLELRLLDVCIAAAGRLLRTVTARADCDLGEEAVITDEHIYSLNLMGVQKAYEVIREQTEVDDINFYCVGYSVIHYYLNDYPIANLEGHKAAKISTEMIATFLPEDVIDGLYRSVERAGLYVANLTLEPIAAINVAIPEKFRLLNIALVDVGAGTSDICITRDGSIIAYGMIPFAGDEMTEQVAREYLADFQTAEMIKTACSSQEYVEFNDVIGIPHKVETKEVVEKATDTIRDISQKIADKIIELNGDKAVSAVFLVGGGGKIPTFTEHLAEFLQIMPERVALRGEEVLTNVEFLQEGVVKDSLLVTPIGICLNYYEQKNRFIFVNVNGERVKLYDNNKLTIVDAALQIGIQNEYLFPRRGKALIFTVDGKKRMVRGKEGEAAVVMLNSKPAGINSEIQANDVVDITYSTVGESASCEINRLPEYKQSITFTFNGKNVICPKFAMANGELVSGFYDIQENDEIRILNYYTLKQVLDFMDIPASGEFYVNHVEADMDEKIYDNFSIISSFSGTEAMYADFRNSYGEWKEEEPVRQERNDYRTKEEEERERDANYNSIFREIAYMEGAEAGYEFDRKLRESENASSAPEGSGEEREAARNTESSAPALPENIDRIGLETAEAGTPPVSNHAKAGSDRVGLETAEAGTPPVSYHAEAGSIRLGLGAAETGTTAGAGAPSVSYPANNMGQKMDSTDEGAEDISARQSAILVQERKAATAGSFQNTIYPPVFPGRDGADWEAGTSAGPEKLNAAPGDSQRIHITVNGEPTELKGKRSYIFVDILDAYPFDTSTAGGSMLDLKVNGLNAEFTSAIKEGDSCIIEWKD